MTEMPGYVDADNLVATFDRTSVDRWESEGGQVVTSTFYPLRPTEEKNDEIT